MLSSIFLSAKRQMSTKRWLRLRELEAYFRVPVWALGHKGRWNDCYLPLHANVVRLWKLSGQTWLVSYLKECTRIVVYWVSGTPYTILPNGVRVARARSGLPLILPARLRYLIFTYKSKGATAGWIAMRITLTLFSVYRVIGCRPNLKLATITDAFNGLAATLPEAEVRHAVALFGCTLSLKPALPDLFSEAAGPNYPRATWSSGLDALAFLCYPRVWAAWITIAVSTRSWTLLFWQLGLIFIGAPVVPLLTYLGVMPFKLGRLSKLFEAAGKVRVVAITDWWTQCLLFPLHVGIFDILKNISQDGTHNQTRPLESLNKVAIGRPSYSFDLTAATDRLPIDLQCQVLSHMGVRWSKTWRALLTKRPWYLGSKQIMYTVGQPMGAYSSWAMLALTHHVIVQVAAYRVGWRYWFPYYALLGDDIVIRDAMVAGAYSSLMSDLGVPINMSKSLVSETGSLEFAKRWIHPDLGEFSPLGPGLILVTIRNLRFIPLVVHELITKNFGFMQMRLNDLIQLISILRRKTPKDLPMLVSLLSLGPSGGLWGSGQLSARAEAWIASYHKDTSPDVLSQHVFYALCAKTIVDTRRALDSTSAAARNLKQN